MKYLILSVPDTVSGKEFRCCPNKDMCWPCRLTITEVFEHGEPQGQRVLRKKHKTFVMEEKQ